jgi:hypothetical protein
MHQNRAAHLREAPAAIESTGLDFQTRETQHSINRAACYYVLLNSAD